MHNDLAPRGEEFPQQRSRLALPEALTLAGWIAALPLLALAVRRVRWREAAAGPIAQVWPASLAALVALWSIRGSVEPHFAFHLSGIAALALASGPWLALVGGAVVVTVTFALGGAPWANAGIAWLTSIWRFMRESAIAAPGLAERRRYDASQVTRRSSSLWMASLPSRFRPATAD